MNPEAQRISIAEACGWKYGNLAGIDKPIIPDYSSTGWFEPDGVHRDTAPGDYLNDLNAMHEAEWHNGPATVKAMRFWLWQICDEMTGHSASAPQRAEALLRALGKWVESE